MDDDDVDDGEHVFVSSGEACGICEALDGQTVTAGYKAHDNCLCQTQPKTPSGCEVLGGAMTGRKSEGWGSVEVEVTVR